ncbi:hypothetical protein B0H63DRAFT_139508 [Podospora didyma]|uniref:Uncharacterized protein n=1 Tax=Podospora didyma TaxID=330526 RepID=A0AAE0NSE3_9PEZI|nr:hypothetical protein B0H63DRAFT_139508 [Podospora didyma]
MAEIFAVTASVLAVGQLASSCVRMAKALVAVKDDKFDELYWRMEAEKGRTIEWTKSLAAVNYSPPREQEKQFTNLLHGLADRYRDLEAILNKVYPQGIPDRGISVRMTVLSRRLLFEFGRFEELKQTLNTISAMNDYLKQFSLPPSKIKYTCDSSVTSEPVEVSVGEHSSNRGHPKQLSIQSDVSTQSHALHSTSNSQQDSTHLISKHPPVKPLPFSGVYQLGLQILERLSKVSPTPLPHNNSSNPVSRLQLWGTGLFRDKTAKFDAELDLERLWTTRSGQRHRKMGIFVMQTLIGILISELLILEIVISELPEDSPHQKPLQKDKSKIQLTLAEEDLADIVRERFEAIFPSWDDIDASHDNEETADTQAARTGWEDNVKDNPPSISSCVEDIEVSIHCLYTVLPSICSCRQSHSLDLEAKQSAMAAESEQVSDAASVSVTPQRASPTESSATYFASSSTTASTPATTPATSLNFEGHKAIIERNLKLAKELVEIFKSEEKFYRRNKKTIRKFSPELEQEVKRLEEYYDSLTRPDGRVLLTQQKFQAGLEQNHAGMEIIKLIYEPTTLSPKKGNDLLKNKGGDSKDGGAALVTSVEEQIETMVKQFTTPTFHGLPQRNRGPLVSAADG